MLYKQNLNIFKIEIKKSSKAHASFDKSVLLLPIVQSHLYKKVQRVIYQVTIRKNTHQ